MEGFKEVKLASGAVLNIGKTPFEVSKGLFQAVVKNFKSVEIPADVKTYEGFVGALLGSQISDPEIEKWMWACLGRCTYNNGKADLKIDPSMFEDENYRLDFIDICLEVGQENLRPFMKGLFLALPRLSEIIANIQKPK